MYRLLSLCLLFCLLACEPVSTAVLPITPTVLSTPPTAEVIMAETAVSTPQPTTTIPTATLQPPPTAISQPTATATLPPTASPADLSLSCLELPRPALISKKIGQDEMSVFTIWHPDTNATCDISLPFAGANIIETSGNTIYFHQWSEETGANFIRYQADGSINTFPLPDVTTFTILPDALGQRIAWNKIEIDEETELLTSTIYVTDLAAEQTTELISINNQAEVDQKTPYIAWILRPVRFLEDSLLYTIDPSGKGGSWNAYTGKYSNLFQIPLAGGEATTIYECPENDHSDCIGDISPDNQWLAITNRDEKQIAVVALDGTIHQTYTSGGEDYVGQPHFNEAEQLLFLSATTGDDRVEIEESWINVVDISLPHRLSVPQKTKVTYLRGWLNPDQFVVWSQGEGVQVANFAGELISLPPDLNRMTWVLTDDK